MPEHKLILTLLLIVILSGCSAAEPGPIGNKEEKIKVVATTTIIADIVKQIGGDMIDITVLLPVGVDPHSFDPGPQDITTLSNAHVVFANGLVFESFLAPIMKSAGVDNRIVELSKDIPAIFLKSNDPREDHKSLFDQHTWNDPNNVIEWVTHIEKQLTIIDPSNAGYYHAKANSYKLKLEELDKWIRETIDQIPVNERIIVSDHFSLGHFALQYDFTTLGAIISSSSTIAEPSAKELAALEDTIRENQVKAIFVGNTGNGSLAEQIARDTDVELFFILTGSLTDKNGLADNYLDYIRYNVNTIVSALK